MKTTNYLYGIDPLELENKMYFEALQYKYDAGTRLYRELWLKPVRDEEESARMHHVWRAQEHTKKLLEER